LKDRVTPFLQGDATQQMNETRLVLGFDLRSDPGQDSHHPLRDDQRLTPHLQSPISADPAVWRSPPGAEQLWGGVLQDFSNPLNLAKDLDLLERKYSQRSTSTTGSWPICITAHRTIADVLVKRYGRGYFESFVDESELTSKGWRHLGFDVIDLNGLISGLKGCGYTGPLWSQLRNEFYASLNEIGLFTDLSIASRFAEVRGLEIPEHAPFVTVGLLTRGGLC
jgi:hypothetical protein